MIDIRYICENPQEVIERLAAKGCDAADAVAEIVRLDGERRAMILAGDNLKARQNKASKEIPAIKKAGGDASALMEEMKALSDEIKENDARLREVEARRTELLLSLPNLPDPDVVPGGKENNQELRRFGKPHVFDFQPRDHVELCTELGLIDYPRGTKLSGNGFWVYRGMGARLEWALLNYFIDSHLADGYEFVMVPHMLAPDCGTISGQFPKFADEVYWIDGGEEGRRYFLLPTAETALVSLHAGELMDENALPRKYAAYTPCFRKEAGSYRTDERGMVRGHQFNKVEMVQYTRPEDSDAAFEELVGKAERLVSGLGFHFRTVKLAAGDCSASMARTYDIEIHIPSMGGYKEVSSVSNSRDYQARRGNIRFRREATGKPEFVHTLNGSGLATSRILPAIVEQNQRPDGSVEVPEALRKYLGGTELLTKTGSIK